mmetsp:Transcript_17629/g.32433  ORF Transcript_17629/g.32433 Transcript_17629/m.32433 type:complete len:769 (+) Transcript_17629:106-2412(+)
MRVLIKGGVWKNSEDEILKAGIMKYGKNEWGRVATLLPRKTAKQCKRRWYEWLDPMIKKTEWTREEDEKLLHLAKLMPTQWRTIAPLIGRTAGQCLERYGKLLDMAAGTEVAEDKAHKLRVGEIDPNPEMKPARPDPVDMDDDEKEMLNEAKARLANISGKKAKRKARERLLENARRMARLQKYRELKAAGVSGNSVLMHEKKNAKGGMDYANEVPFEHRVPAGFYDTTEEQHEGLARSRTESGRKRLLETANEEPAKRAKQEQDAMKRDRERFEKLAKDNLEQAMKEIEERNASVSGLAGLKRKKLSLPAPQVTDADLEEIARLGRKRQATGAAGDLAGEYEVPTLSRASELVRTPVAPDVVMEEARNQKLRTKAETPLTGGENVVTSAGTGFAGYAPSVQSVVTPTVVTQGLSKKSIATGATAVSTSFPVRDHLNINQDANDDEMSEALVPKREQKERRKAELTRLRSQLQALPAPKDLHEVVISGAVIPEDEAEEQLEVDASDKAALERTKQSAAARAALESRTEVAKRGLPRPQLKPAQGVFEASSANERNQSEKLIDQSARELIEWDVEERLISRDWPRLTAADKLIRDQALESFGAAYADPDTDKVAALYRKTRGEPLVMPGKEKAGVLSAPGKKGGRAAPLFDGPFRCVPRENASEASQLAALRLEFFMIERELVSTTSTLKKVTKKASRLTLGLQARASKAAGAFIQAQASTEAASREVQAFSDMKATELASIPQRQYALRDRVNALAATQAQLQAELLA